MNSNNDPANTRPPYHPGVQASGWIPPCWTIPTGQIPVWPTFATNQYGQVVQQPICFAGQMPAVVQQQQQAYLQTETSSAAVNFQPPFQFAASEPPSVKQEPTNHRQSFRGRRHGRRSGSHSHGPPRLYRTRQEIERDRQPARNQPVFVRQPQTEAEKQEVEAWIAQRKKNYPRQENAVVESGRTNSERAKELREILNRQQQMGIAKYSYGDRFGLREFVCSIAGTDGLFQRIGSNRPDCSRGGFGGMNKRKRFEQSEHQGKRILQNGHFNRRQVVRKPMSLLDKLLYKDTRRQKSHALQCIRFFVENNFLQDLGKKPLVFPCDPEETNEEEAKPSPPAPSNAESGEDSDVDDCEEVSGAMDHEESSEEEN